MSAHLYWRLNIAANDGDTSYTQISELELRTSVGGANQATGGTATASSVTSGFEASKAFDADTSTRWSTAVSQMVSWIQYQFASPVDIVEHAITAPAASMTRAPKNYSVQWSDDGNNWTSAAIVQAQTAWGVSEKRVFTHSSWPVAIGVGVLPPAYMAMNQQAVPSPTVNAVLRGDQLGGKVYSGPSKTISGTVKQEGVPVARTVRAYHRASGDVLGETTSNATTGAFSISSLGHTDQCYVLALDNLNLSPDYNAVICDLVVPT